MTDAIALEAPLNSASLPATTFPPELEGLLVLVSDDERPTFIVHASELPRIAYQNSALIELVKIDSSFEAWVSALPTEIFHPDGSASVTTAGSFAGMTWLSKRIGNGPWTVIYCARHKTVVVPETQQVLQNGKNHAQEGPSSPARDYISPRISDWFFDWTRFSFRTDDPWISFLQCHEWSNTRLGPMQDWPEDLSRLAICILSAPDPRFILWGDELLVLFNAAAKPILGDRYLACLGNPLAEGLGPSVVEKDLECLRRTLEHGTAIKEINLEYILTRHGFAEEAYFDFHISPVPGVSGHLVGAVIEFSETTTSMVQIRKQYMAAAVFEQITLAKNLESLWSGVAKGLVHAPKYIVYAAVYARIERSESHTGSQYRLSESAGLDAALLSSFVDVDGQGGIAAAFRNTPQTPSGMLLRQKDETLPKELAISLSGGGTINTAGILVIESGTPSKQPLAFIVVGFNPKLHVLSEDTYYLHHLRDVFSKSAAVMELPEEQRRDDRLASLNEELANKLQITATQAKKSEENFARMARNAPFGMYMFRPDGAPMFVNETWLKLCGFSSREELDNAVEGGPFWRDKIPPDDYTYITNVWRLALTSKTPTRIEHQLAIPRSSDDSESDGPQYRWLEGNSFPDLDEDDNIMAMQGWLIDITDRKRAEGLMAQRLEDALETKRASERFIDMVSHEIRNPLSAILQLADGILGTTHESAESTIDAARTIILCAQHQKKIVDDVLVISKLDSNLLILSPDKSEPPALINKALKMHEAEMALADIQASLHIEQSYKDLDIESVLLDESRILQVVINLLGNAIKFTRSLETRNITISLAASRELPTGKEHGIVFAAQRAVKRPKLQRSQSSVQSPGPLGDSMYMQIAVSDTGRGLTQEDIDRLFRRFSQASPKTYKKYGGSGLGLYISKELIELQGGQIGVKSDGLGKGSTFAFYVRTKRCNAPLLTPSLEASVSVKEFPATKDAGEVDVITKSTMAQVTKSSTTSSNGSSSNKTKGMSKVSGLHVLVVEDNAINQKVMAQQLRRIGCTVHVANHGMEALTFLASTDFQRGYTPLSIVLMDIEMPIMDGLTCTRRIRQLENSGEILRRVPIIAVTANARNQQIADALKAGVDEVVTKPFRIPELLPRMEALVEKRRPTG